MEKAYRNRGEGIFVAFDADPRDFASGGVDCAFEALPGRRWPEVVAALGLRLCALAHQDFWTHCRGVGEILRAKSEGRAAWVGCVPCADPIEGELDRLDLLYGYGVRMMGIAASGSNMLGGGREELSDGGLTAFGRRAVERMNRLGMLIDASRCGIRTALDIIDASEKPVALAHRDPKRPLPDEVLKACAGRGGLVCADADSFERAAELVGIGHVSIADPAPLSGLSDADTQKVLGGNAVELLRRVWVF